MVFAALAAGATAFAVAGLLAYRVPGLLESASLPALLGVAVASGIAALFQDAAPTGGSVLDALLRAALALVCVAAAWSARHSWIAISALGAAAASAHSPLQWVAFVAAALAIAGLFMPQRSPLLQAIVGGAVANVALDLRIPSARFGPSVAAAAVVLPMLVSGYLGAAASVQSWVRRGALAVGIFAAAATVLAAYSGLGARSQLEHGISLARHGLSSVRQGDDAAASADFHAAATAFGKGDDQLQAPWARAGDAVPVLSQHMRALRSMADAGASLGRLSDGVLAIGDARSLEVRQGVFPVDRYAALQPPLGHAVSALTLTSRRLRAVDSPWLIGPFKSRLADLTDKVDQARTDADLGLTAANALPGLLGADGPRHYFLAIETPSELRASGGFIGNFGEIGADNGRLSLDRTGRTDDLNQGGNPASRRLEGPPDYIARYSGFTPQTLWQNVTMSPDFPSVATVIANLYPQSGGRQVDGVIGIDPFGLAALLDVVGPVIVPSWPVPITGNNAPQLLLHDQYVTFADRLNRVDFLGDVVRAVWQKFQTSTPSPAAMVRVMGNAVAQKHLMFASTHAPEAAELEKLHVDGSVRPADKDFVGVVTQNAGGNKIDWYLRRTVDYRASLDPDSHTISSAVDVTLTNTAPSTGQPPVVIGSERSPPAPPGTNSMYFSFYTPWDLSVATVAGAPLALQSQTELGRHVYSAFLDVPPGASTTVHLELKGRLTCTDGYLLRVLRQPTIVADMVTATVSVQRGWALLDGKQQRQSLATRVPVDTDKTMLSTTCRPGS
jgi:hypothetical protein